MKSNHFQNKSKMPAGGYFGEADPLEKALRRIRRTKDFPTISKYLVEINQKLSEDIVHSSASELANIILKDYALTNKLLKLVNSAFYGFVAGKVSTVTRAVVLLGYDNVRLAAISLVLFEHFKGRSGARDLKDATVSSFWCGLIAKEIAKMQYMIDPEEAFICALLHQLGKLLTIYHMPHEYREIKYRVSQQNEKERRAVQQVMGITYKSLGLAVAKQWNFPESIRKTMVPISQEALEDKAKKVDPLCALANFTHALSRVVDTVRLDRRDKAVKKVLERYQNYIVISAKQLKVVMADGLDRLYKHADALQFSVEDSPFLMRLSGEYFTDQKGAKGQADSPSEASHGEAAFRLTAGDDLAAAVNPLEGDDAVSIIMAGIQEISGVMMGEHDINDIALMSLEIIYRALQCQRAIMFIHDKRSQLLEARYGYGADIDRLVGKVAFEVSPSSGSDLFTQAVQGGKDLIVDDARAPELHPLIPKWYSKSIDAPAFVFMPVVYQNICVGAYYLDLDFSGPPINALEHKYLAMLRNQLILGIKMGR